MKKISQSWQEEDKEELGAARIASIVFTLLGVLAVIPFSAFPTIYEAHGYFHSTLTPPLVVAIFLGVFWKKFTPAAVMSTLIGGVAFMVVGMHYPRPLIEFFAQGTKFDSAHPYIYISALYNLVVCIVVGVLTALTTNTQKQIINKIKRSKNHKTIMGFVIGIVFILLILVVFNIGSLIIMLTLSLVMTILIILSAGYYIKYDEAASTDGLTAWSIKRAKEIFKGRKLNETEGDKVKVSWKIRGGEDDTINFSKIDMKKMKAEPGDLVYISDARKYLGGLKSVHSVYGEPHNEDGNVYITEEHQKRGLFVKDKILIAEKEM